MKYLIILTIGVCLLFASVPAMADQAADEAAIRKLMRKVLPPTMKAMLMLLAAFWTERRSWVSWDPRLLKRIE